MDMKTLRLSHSGAATPAIRFGSGNRSSDSLLEYRPTSIGDLLAEHEYDERVISRLQREGVRQLRALSTKSIREARAKVDGAPLGESAFTDVWDNPHLTPPGQTPVRNIRTTRGVE